MNPALPNVPRSSVVRAATGAPPAELTCRRTRSPGANPLPEKPTRCAAFTAYGLTLIVGYRPSIWNGALAAEPLLLPTMKMLLGPTGPIPTFTPTLPTDPPPSACSVPLGSPVPLRQHRLGLGDLVAVALLSGHLAGGISAAHLGGERQGAGDGAVLARGDRGQLLGLLRLAAAQQQVDP